MAAARSLGRLLRVQALEEEQMQKALESGLAYVRCLQNTISSVLERERMGRRLLAISAHNGEAIDRLAALHEMAAARRSATALRPKIAQAEQTVTLLREQFLAKRVERRQVETLIREAQAREAAERSRRAQQSLDDWYLGRFNERPQSQDELPDELEIRGRT